MPKRARVSSLLVQALEGVDITATILQFLDVTSLRNLEEVVGPSSLSAAYRALPYHLGELGSGYDLRNVFMWVQARGIACASLGISSWYHSHFQQNRKLIVITNHHPPPPQPLPP
jgi:hypothetical protein